MKTILPLLTLLLCSQALAQNCPKDVCPVKTSISFTSTPVPSSPVPGVPPGDSVPLPGVPVEYPPLPACSPSFSGTGCGATVGVPLNPSAYLGRKNAAELIERSKTICPKCGKVCADYASETAQTVAQQRADWMATHGKKLHPPLAMGNWTRFGSFEGVGWSTRGNPSTCVPKTPKVLVADATSRSRHGTFRVRIWK